MCEKSEAAYTCPRCRAPYCSVACYKRHSEACVASFHGDTLAGLLRGEKVGDEQRAATVAMLQRQHEEARQEAEEAAEEAELLRALELCDREDFDPSMLPPHIRAQFEAEAFAEHAE